MHPLEHIPAESEAPHAGPSIPGGRGTPGELFRFAQISVLSFVLNFGSTYVLHEGLRLPAEAAFAIALVIVFITNFLFQRFYIFGSVSTPLGVQLTRFAFSTLCFRGSEYLMFVLVHTWLGVQYLLAMVVILGISFILKFVVNKTLVFE